ncbi:MAG: glycosyltransferase family 2 protein [Bacteroidia bacterium]|nr:glycosyltransferase family 2 protein [Bacteroidia bacterium]
MNASLDIVLPCYNPAEEWAERVIEGYEEIVEELPEERIHLILVNDGSSKALLPEDIEKLRNSIPFFEFLDIKINQGKGAALRSGVSKSKAAICIFTDIDFPYRTPSFLKIFQLLKEKETDIAIGIKDRSYYSHLPWLRIQVSKFLRFLARTFMRISITDTQCGLKGFNAKGRDVFLQTTIKRYLADLEFIFLSDRRKDLTMKSVEVSLRPGIIFSKVNPRILFAEGINFLRVFFRSLGS